ncbi:Os01g0978500, partial [Oryza sativa Japonica Group]
IWLLQLPGLANGRGEWLPVLSSDESGISDPFACRLRWWGAATPAHPFGGPRSGGHWARQIQQGRSLIQCLGVDLPGGFMKHPKVSFPTTSCLILIILHTMNRLHPSASVKMGCCLWGFLLLLLIAVVTMLILPFGLSASHKCDSGLQG